MKIEDAVEVLGQMFAACANDRRMQEADALAAAILAFTELKTLRANPSAGVAGAVACWRGMNSLGEVVTEWIAASPDLLDALRSLVNACAEDGWPRVADQMMPLAIARAAIAKATGAQP